VVLELVSTGILMGIIHVLTGPDHLSALATLSGTTPTARTHPLEGFLLGVRWGLGHSIGILCVGTTLILLQESSAEWIGMDPMLSTSLEAFVGCFMLLLGFYGITKSLMNKRLAHESAVLESIRLQNEKQIEKGAAAAGVHRRGSVEILDQMADVLNRDGDSMRSGHFSEHEEDDVERRIFHAVESLRRNSDTLDDDDDDDHFLNTLKSSAKASLSRSFVKAYEKKPAPMKASSLVNSHANPKNSMVEAAAASAASGTSKDRSVWARACRCCTPNGVAIVAGIVHGVAGPGGVLGVIPAVQLRNARMASVYLGTFCIVSTLVMGCFAASYGTFSEWLAGGSYRGGGKNAAAGRVFLVEFGSAFLSVCVGIVWLTLLSLGQLEQVFEQQY